MLQNVCNHLPDYVLYRNHTNRISNLTMCTHNTTACMDPLCDTPVEERKIHTGIMHCVVVLDS
jgi:hypothetical protein